MGILHLVTDWEDLIELFREIPHEVGTAYPEPRTGDVWVIDGPFWNAETVGIAVASQVSVMLVGVEEKQKVEAETVGAASMIGNEIDPEALMRWVNERLRTRPHIRKTERRGIIVAFAGLLPTGGGVGKDAFSLNTAAWLAVQGKSVAIIDLDPNGTIKERVGMETTLSVEVWEEHFMGVTLTPETVKNALVFVKNLKFWLMPASRTRDLLPDHVIRHMAEWLPLVFDVVLFNLGSDHAGKMFVSALREADQVFLFGSGDRGKFKRYPEVLEDYFAVLEVEPKIIFNKFYNKDAPQFFEEEYGYQLFAYALEDRRVYDLTELGKAAALEQPKRPFGMAVQKIGRAIIGESSGDDNAKTPESKKKGGFWPW